MVVSSDPDPSPTTSANKPIVLVYISLCNVAMYVHILGTLKSRSQKIPK